MAVTGVVRSGLVIGLLLGTVAACGSPAGPPGPRTTPPTASSPPAPRTTAAATADQALPRALVGVWRSDAKNSDASLTYRFRGDGAYTFVGVLAYDSPDGTVQVTHTSEGTARVEGTRLVLTPEKAVMSRRDPSDPEGDHTSRPAGRAPQRHRWEVRGDDLALTDGTGLRVTYARRSP
ncbi:hypothetical protein ACIQXA_28425 [Streptomyces massasporeus]|uniref:hypothetical protein n=1 Tax=Streptomyces massasporeus TaxID=67324 RepID=UPI0037F67394